MAEQNFYHEPADVNGRSGWLVHDTATGELVGFRADSGPQAAGRAVNEGSQFPTMASGFEFRDRSADTDRQYTRLRLAEPADRGGPEVRVLPEPGLIHARHACPACKAERVHLPPAQPKQAVR
jgi:hypothetical protein